MKKQTELDGRIARSSSRMRESVRCLPKGHFQQIRQMFDKQSCAMIIYEQQKQKPFLSNVLLELSVTDDEKLQHTTNIDDVFIDNNKSF
jgi:hypothetical protein